MAKVIMSWCDFCLDQEPEVYEPGQPVVIAFDGKASKVMDICEVHQKEHIEPLREWLTKYGQGLDIQPQVQSRNTGPRGGEVTPADGATQYSEERVPCPICSKVGKRKSLPSHFGQVHPEESLWRIMYARGETLELLICICGGAYGSRSGFQLHKRRAPGGPHALNVAESKLKPGTAEHLTAD